MVAALAPAAAGAAGWLPMTSALNGTGAQIRHPAVAVDDVGNVYAAWTEGSLMEVSKRPVGGVFEMPQTLDPTSNFPSSSPDIAVDGAGNAIVVWTEAENSDTHHIMQARRSTGASSFGSPSEVNSGSTSNKDTPRLAVNHSGEAVLAVQAPTSGVGVASVFLGSSTGGVTQLPAVYREGSDTSIFPPDAALNDPGDAVVAWPGIPAR